MRQASTLLVYILVGSLLVGGCGGEATTRQQDSAAVDDGPSLPGDIAVASPPVLIYQTGYGPVSTLVAYDLAAMRELWSIPMGRGSPLYTSIGGRRVAMGSPDSVVIHSIDGAPPRELALPKADSEYFEYLALSPDGRTLAIVRDETSPPEPELQPGTPGPAAQWQQSLIFFDADSLREIRRVTLGQPEFAGFDTSFGPLAWLPDGSGVFVWGATHSERPGSYATVLLDGTVVRHQLKGAAYVSHDFGRAVEGIGSLGCLFYSGHEVTIRDLKTGAVLAGVQNDTRALTGVDWSPDNREFLFESRPWSPDLTCEGDRWWAAEPQLFVLHADTGALETVPSHESVYRRWYGDRLIWLDCDGVFVPPRPHPFGNAVSLSCRGSQAEGTLYAYGRAVAAGRAFRIYGVINQ